MESYPGELLVGVFPLVFCVDATLSSKEAVDNADHHSARSQFDRFLDVMAASLLDEPDANNGNNKDNGSMYSPNSGRRRMGEDGMLGLFREGEMDSDQEDDAILGSDTTTGSVTTAMTSGNTSHEGSELDPKRRTFPFPRLGREGSMGLNRNSRNTHTKEVGSGVDMSFAKTLQEGQGFFQRARIVSISHRHGFPPSKDPSGKDNRIRDFFLGKTLKTSQVLSATKRRPIDGILPSGWLEKHAAALPSVIIVVAQVSSHQQQHEQDSLLEETIQNLQISLAPKRQCTIRVVGLVQDGISTSMSLEWKKTMSETLGNHLPVTLLDVADLQQDEAPSMTLRTFQRSIHDASLRYYVTQARHTKHKLYELGQARGTPLLLPLCIRYCFKVAMFYEFQWNPEKSLKYLSEAYRYVETYYRYLLQQREIANNVNEAESAESDKPKIRLSSHPGNSLIDDETEGVEMSLPAEDDINNLMLNPPAVSDDMVHQCRALADWLNFKILQSCFTSHTESGLLAASTQLQKHAQAFCNPLHSFICSPDHAYVDWSFVAHQRMVASQLLERNPPRVLGELGKDFDEVLLRCSPWKTYEAAAEALLRLGAEVNKAMISTPTIETIIDEMRSRYVGGLDKSAFQPKLQEESKVHHRELALDCLRRAISFYERDVEKQKMDNPEEGTVWTRSGARMYYLTGGTLLGLERYEEAAPFLLKAATLTKGWKDLEVKCQQLLIECFKKYTPKDANEYDQTLTSLLLDSLFSIDIPIIDLQQELKNLASRKATQNLQWLKHCFDESDGSLPFSFALNFPAGTHATAGDKVKCSLGIKSNLGHAVHVKNVAITTLAGQTSISPSDLLNAKGAVKGIDFGIVVPAYSSILISTQIQLPKNVIEMGLDESATAKDKEGILTKGILKSPRPRTGGMTAAAGTRFLSEQNSGATESNAMVNHWSQKCLGGRALYCNGISLLFSPVDAAALTPVQTQIEMLLEKKEMVPHPNIKRTPFEEENYIPTCWSRPLELPWKLGPKCLRVLPPLANMIVTNITENYTSGKVIEGTVNRILLQLKAGPHEECRDIAIRLSCSSVLVTSSGGSTKIATKKDDGEDDTNVVDPRNPYVRNPVLLREDKQAKGRTIEYGYDIPNGWELLGQDEDGYTPVAEVLNNGDHTFAFFDVFRPSPRLIRLDDVHQHGMEDEGLMYEQSTCQTDVQVSIRYHQKRVAKVASSDDHEPDVVVLTQTIPIVWSAPISATFSPGLKTSHPCGNRHPTNTIQDAISRRNPPGISLDDEMVLIDGERVSCKCSLESAAAADNLFVEIDEIKFENADDENVPCTFDLLSGKDETGLLYKAHDKDPCRKLILGSKFSIAWASEVHVKSHYLKGSVSASLGILSITWSPSPLEIPDEVVHAGYRESISSHGPLPLSTPSTCRFVGPPCYIENAPFETTMDKLPDNLEVATPFEITYHIRNKTSWDQKLTVSLDEGAVKEPLCFMIDGLVTGEVALGPFETHTLSYTVIATRTGVHRAPPVCVSSVRYNTWLIRESQLEQTLFISP